MTMIDLSIILIFKEASPTLYSNGDNSLALEDGQLSEGHYL